MATIITTPTQLQAINDNLSGDYELGNDIDMAGVDFTPIGDAYNDIGFTGSFDGKGYTISNLTIDAGDGPSGDYKGLFDFADVGAIIQNTNVTGSISGYSDVGGLLGVGIGVTISKCSFVGTIVGTTYRSGGLVGRIQGNSSIDQCFSSGTVTTAMECGGLIGWVWANDDISITNCYSASTVILNGSHPWEFYGGGFVGDTTTTAHTLTVTNCYSVGAVSGLSYVGGFCGGITNNSGGTTTATSCYWNTETSGQTTSAGTEVGKTTVQMQTQSTFSSWNFITIWIMSGYPVLQVFPYVITTDATYIGQSYATLNGTEAGCTTVYFEYGRSSSTVQSTSALSATATFYRRVDGLSPLTTYYFRAVGDSGATYGNWLSFTTATQPATTPKITPAQIWIEKTKFHYIDGYGVEKSIEGTAV